MRLLLPVAIVILIVLFVIGVVAPRRSRRIEHRIDDRLKHAERHTASRAGRLGDWTAKAADLSRRGSDKALELGRRLRRTAP